MTQHECKIKLLFARMMYNIKKGDKGDMANAKMYTFLEQNIGGKTFLRLRK